MSSALWIASDNSKILSIKQPNNIGWQISIIVKDVTNDEVEYTIWLLFYSQIICSMNTRFSSMDSFHAWISKSSFTRPRNDWFLVSVHLMANVSSHVFRHIFQTWTYAVQKASISVELLYLALLRATYKRKTNQIFVSDFIQLKDRNGKCTFQLIRWTKSMTGRELGRRNLSTVAHLCFWLEITVTIVEFRCNQFSYVRRNYSI